MAQVSIANVDVAKMDQLESVWKEVRENVIQSGAITKANGAIASVKDLSSRLGIDLQQPTWVKSLEDILQQASRYEKPSVRVAAAGIARSFRVVAMWGELLAVDKQDKLLCYDTRLVAGRVLRSLSRNPFLKCADWLQEKIGSRLLASSCLPTRLMDSYNRAFNAKARKEDEFDAVQDFSVAGMSGDTQAIDFKVKEMKIGYWRSFLLKTENFLNDVIGPSLSKVDAVANLQVRWRLVVAKIDTLLYKLGEFTADEKKHFDGYVLQFKWMQKSLIRYAKDGLWQLGDDAHPFFHIKRIRESTVESTVTNIQKRLFDSGLATPGVPFVVIETTAI